MLIEMDPLSQNKTVCVVGRTMALLCHRSLDPANRPCHIVGGGGLQLLFDLQTGGYLGYPGGPA